jgi:hypothetical protein
MIYRQTRASIDTYTQVQYEYIHTSVHIIDDNINNNNDTYIMHMCKRRYINDMCALNMYNVSMVNSFLEKNTKVMDLFPISNI